MCSKGGIARKGRRGGTQGLRTGERGHRSGRMPGRQLLSRSDRETRRLLWPVGQGILVSRLTAWGAASMALPDINSHRQAAPQASPEMKDDGWGAVVKVNGLLAISAFELSAQPKHQRLWNGVNNQNLRCDASRDTSLPPEDIYFGPRRALQSAAARCLQGWLSRTWRLCSRP